MFDKSSQENIDLMIDLHNDVNDDSLLLIAKYYLSEHEIQKTQIKDITQKEISLVLKTAEEEKIKRVKFPQEVKDSVEVSNFFYFCLSQARAKAPEDYPKTRLEKQIERTLNLETYITKVKTKKVISSNIIEITFEGGMSNLPDLKNDAFMYFIVHKDINHKYPKGFSMEDFRKMNATEDCPYSAAYYTIRSFRKNEIDVWFVLHDHPGPLAKWAEEAEKNSEVAIWGPRTTFTPPADTDNYLFIADETAQPAVLASIENLKHNAKFTCLFETQDQSSRFEYEDNENSIEWIYRGDQKAGEGTKLLEKINQISRDPKNLYVFGAGEAKQISKIRKTLKRNLNLNSDQMSFTGYWRKTH